MIAILIHQYRPEYHFTPAANWMNDPNGMVYFKGTYHLFYQYHPYGTTWGPMHWGHATSLDMVKWNHQPIALSPDTNGMIFSGSAVVDWKDSSGFFDGQAGLVAIFTHHDQEPGTGRVRQRQSLAYSLDSGETWAMYDGNPVLEHETYRDFRDPKVFWHRSCEHWVMILACGQTVCMYISRNLKEWTFASEFGQGAGSHDGVWECPDLFPLHVDGDSSETTWIMFVSIGNAEHLTEGSRTQIFTGKFDGFTFVNDKSPEVVRWLDHGRDNYAGVSWSNIPAEDGRRIYIGWMSNWRYANLTPTGSWRGAMTIPRELTLESRNGEDVLVQRPIREMNTRRKQVLSVKNMVIEAVRTKLADLQLDSFEIIADIQTGSEGIFSFRVRASDAEETIIGYNCKQSELFVDRSCSGNGDFHEDFLGKHGVHMQTKDGHILLRIYVDRSSVEVFADDGAVVVTDLIFPAPEAKGLKYAADGDTILHSLEIYELSLD